MENNTEILFKQVVDLAEKVFEIENTCPEMLSISVLPTNEGGYQAALIYTKNIDENNPKFLDYPVWYRNKSHNEELYAESSTLNGSLKELNSILETMLNYKESTSLKPIDQDSIWIVKNYRGKYYNCLDHDYPWSIKQKNATKFNSLEKANEIVALWKKKQGARAVKLKGSLNERKD